MASANLTGTSRFDFEINEQSSFILSLRMFQKVGAVKTPIDFPAAVWRASIQDSDGNIVLTLTQGDGLSVVGNLLTMNRNYIQMVLPNGKYKYDVRGDLPDNNNVLPLIGEITIKRVITPIP
jgi:hypothetical protein